MYYDSILWDWNGTLLNDLNISIDAMNELLSRRALPSINTDYYKSVFDFPVINYYKILGFDFNKESWDDVAAEYMQEYYRRESALEIYDDTIPALEFFKAKGFRQYILSAMKTDSIGKMLKTFNIEHYFNGIYGLDNHYANGKIDMGHHLLKTECLIASQCLMIGDTLHDAEVADSLKCNAILISQGHHNKERLESSKHITLPNLRSLIKQL